MRESELRAPVLAHLAAKGYRTWVAPDGRDYFDVVALRGEEVGLVELKVSGGPKVFGQALRRRAWSDWVAVALPGERAARRLLARASDSRADRVGIWVVAPSGVRELRAARPILGPGEEDPFAEARSRLRAVLASMEEGTLPEGVGWGIFSAPRPPGTHRSTRDWRIEEFVPP